MTMKKEEYEVRSARMEDIDALVFIDHASFSIPWSKESLQTFVQDGLHRDCFVAVITERRRESSDMLRFSSLPMKQRFRI